MKPPPNSPPARRKPGQGVHTRIVPGRQRPAPAVEEDWGEDGRARGTWPYYVELARRRTRQR